MRQVNQRIFAGIVLTMVMLFTSGSACNPKALIPDAPGKQIRSLDAAIEATADTVTTLSMNDAISRTDGREIIEILKGADRINDRALLAFEAGDLHRVEGLLVLVEGALDEAERFLAESKRRGGD